MNCSTAGAFARAGVFLGRPCWPGPHPEHPAMTNRRPTSKMPNPYNYSKLNLPLNWLGHETKPHEVRTVRPLYSYNTPSTTLLLLTTTSGDGQLGNEEKWKYFKRKNKLYSSLRFLTPHPQFLVNFWNQNYCNRPFWNFNKQTKKQNHRRTLGERKKIPRRNGLTGRTRSKQKKSICKKIKKEKKARINETRRHVKLRQCDSKEHLLMT